MTRSRGVFVSWTRFQGRSEDLAAELEVPSHFVRGDASSLPRRYRQQWQRTGELLRQLEPGVVAVMQPPIFAFWATRAYVRKSNARVLADLHSGAFLNPKWRWSLPLLLRALRGRHAAIVTNAALAARVERAGVTCFELHDPIPDATGVDVEWKLEDAGLRDQLRPGEYFLVPFAYENDEPVREVLAAARLRPEQIWVLTGKAPQAVIDAAPSNVVFTGYVSNNDYSVLLHGAAAMFALTTRDFTMQRVGYEAEAAGRVLVTTDFPVLRDYFADGAVYTAPTGAAIADAAGRALTDAVQLRAAILERARLHRIAHDETVERIRAWISAGAEADA
jgi:hypothetical protein